MKLRSDKTKSLFAPVKFWKRALLLVLKASPKYTVGWAALLVVQGCIPVIVVYLTKIAIDSVVAASNSNGDWNRITGALGILGLMAVLLLLTEVLQHASLWIRTAQSESFQDRLTDMIHRKAAEIDISFYESSQYHDLMEQARGESSSKPLALLESFGAVIQNSISVFGMGALLLTYGWWLPVVLVLGTIPALYIALYTDRQYHQWWKTTADERRWTTYFDAMLTNSNAAAEMRLFDLSGRFRSLYQRTRSRLRTEKLDHLRKQGYGRIAASLVALITAVGAMGWMAVRVLYNQATLGDLGLFYQIFSRGQTLIGSLLQGVGKTFNSSLYLENLFEFLDLQPEICSPPQPQRPPASIADGIHFNSVSFTYPGSNRPVIKDFDLFVPAGTVVALVGVNGSGKSTLIKLLNRFYDVSEGSIEIDGIDLRQFDPIALRRMMSVLYQFPMHYHALANENILLGDYSKEKCERQIIAAARGAGAHDFIMDLPKQYDTLLGKWFVDGTELSGGEWQRLALARAYFRRAPIVILDEPTSFMDSWSELDWFDRFRQMVDGHTGIVITHRFTIAMRADIIHVIDAGRLVESGTHGELIKSDGLYANSWKMQMKTAEDAADANSQDALNTYDNLQVIS